METAKAPCEHEVVLSTGWSSFDYLCLDYYCYVSKYRS
jgi:hypothetical protein